MAAGWGRHLPPILRCETGVACNDAPDGTRPDAGARDRGERIDVMFMKLQWLHEA